MTFTDDIATLLSPGDQGSDIKATNTPESWRARSEVGPEGGYVISTPRKSGEIPDAADILRDFKLDPDSWRVVSVRKSQWQNFKGDWLEAARISIVPLDSPANTSTEDFEKLLAEMKKWRPSTKIKQSVGDGAYVSATGDGQLGKDAGGGTAATIIRVRNSIYESANRFRELKKMGRSIGQIVLPQMGDCIEGSVSQKGAVIGKSDIGVTFQVRLGHRLLLEQVKTMAPLAQEILIPVVPGNHDVVHKVVFTDTIDSWQVEVVSIVEDICKENPALAHVKFRYPEREKDSLAINVGGQILGMVHGNQFKDVSRWMANQSVGRSPVGNADVLLTAHYHHWASRNIGKTLWMQIPAMDGGSPQFASTSGTEAHAGIVTFLMGNGYEPLRDFAMLAIEHR